MANPKPAEIAYVDRSIFQAKGLFAERPSWGRKASERKLFHFDKGCSLEVQLAAPLGSFHLLCLMATIGEAQARLVWQKQGGSDQLDQEMREALKLKGKAAEGANLTLALSYYNFAACIGRPYTIYLRKQIDEALLDLAGARFVWGTGEAYNLLAFKKSPHESGKPALRISLCPALSEVINNQGPCARISMDEARRLKHPSSILLHGWLSSIISPGRAFPINIDTILEGVVWAKKAEKGSSTYWTRRSALLRKLLPDLEHAGWEWNFDRGKDQVHFKRPSLDCGAEDIRIQPDQAGIGNESVCPFAGLCQKALAAFLRIGNCRAANGAIAADSEIPQSGTGCFIRYDREAEHG